MCVCVCVCLQLRREEYERHIRELEDELRQREQEQKMLMSTEAEQEGRGEEGGARERRRSTLLHPSSSPTKFDYSAYHDPVTFAYHDFTKREVGSAWRPHSGLTEWE